MSVDFEVRGSDSPLVNLVWQGHSTSTDRFTSTASIHLEMVLTKGVGGTSITVRGPETQASAANIPDDTEWLGITFGLGAFLPRFPTVNLVNHHDVTLPQASSRSFWLAGAAWQFPTYDNADAFVEKLVRAGLLHYDPLIDTALQGELPALTLRAIQSRFRRATGLSHTTIRQIQRAQHAQSLLEQGVSILDTVHLAGYFDQPHLTRALKRYMGQTPAQVSREIMRESVPA